MTFLSPTPCSYVCKGSHYAAQASLESLGSGDNAVYLTSNGDHMCMLPCFLMPFTNWKTVFCYLCIVYFAQSLLSTRAFPTDFLECSVQLPRLARASKSCIFRGIHPPHGFPFRLSLHAFEREKLRLRRWLGQENRLAVQV